MTMPHRFDRQAGHISIAHGDIPFRCIDWTSLLCAPDETLDDVLSPHFLSGVERTDMKVDLYVMKGSLKLHTDEPGLGSLVTTLGLILDCDEDLELTTGRNRVPAKIGDVYRLHPLKQHGAHTKGFLAFATQDYREHECPSPAEFREQAIEQMSDLLVRRKIRFEVA